MNTDISPQQVRQDLLQRFCVASFNIEDLLAFGEQRNWCFLVEKQKGVLENPRKKGDWIYQKYDPNSITLHPKAEEYLDEVVEAGFPIRQIIYGYQVRAVSVNPQPTPRIRVPDEAIETITSLAKFALVATAGLAMVIGSAFVAGLSAIDPKIIVVLDTGEEERKLPWVCLMSWDDEPENS